MTSCTLCLNTCEADEIYRICSAIGSPTKIEWVEGLELTSAINYQFPQLAAVPLSVLIPSASKATISLITSLCSWDPCKRPTALKVLQHPFFKSCYYVSPSLRSKPAVVRTPPFGLFLSHISFNFLMMIVLYFSHIFGHTSR